MRASWLMAAPWVAAWATMVRWRSMGRCWNCALSRQSQICSRRSRACSSESRWGMSVSSISRHPQSSGKGSLTISMRSWSGTEGQVTVPAGSKVSGHFRPVSKELNEILFFIKRKRVFKTSIFKTAEHAGISF